LPTIEELNETFADMTHMICRLCQRQFKSSEILLKHLSMSDLHKQNIEKHIETLRSKMQTGDEVSEDLTKSYRDRAEERRHLFKDSDIPPGVDRAREERAAFEESRPVETSLGPRGEIGAKLLQQMGWSEGEGLGKHKSGIQAPVEVHLRPSGLGLGADHGHSPSPVIDPSESYAGTVKASARYRFESLYSKNYDEISNFDSKSPSRELDS
jgi:RNA-binding protein 5/10